MMDKYEQKISQEFGPCECDSVAIVMAVLREAVAAEREACAAVADQFSEVTARIDGGISRSTTAAGMANIAAAIRARST